MSPIIRNPNAAMLFKTFAGIMDAILLPAITPNRLAVTRASEEPKKTAKGLLELPLIATVANWVLSPSSARKTVVKVVKKRVNMIGQPIP